LYRGSLAGRGTKTGHGIVTPNASRGGLWNWEWCPPFLAEYGGLGSVKSSPVEFVPTAAARLNTHFGEFLAAKKRYW